MGLIHAPESDLVGEHRGVVSQIDIMPTLLSLLGNDKPYFAFGRDLFQEPQQQPFAAMYDNNAFQVVMDDYLVRFDEKQIIGVYALDDTFHENNLVGEVDLSDVEMRLKALIQSYYSRVENKDYGVHEGEASVVVEK